MASFEYRFGPEVISHFWNRIGSDEARLSLIYFQVTRAAAHNLTTNEFQH
jgi:hypothetical protein